MAKIMTCIAVLDNDTLIENLRECIEILGGTPIVSNNTVKVTTSYPSDLASHLLLLYEQYWRHEIIISES